MSFEGKGFCFLPASLVSEPFSNKVNQNFVVGAHQFSIFHAPSIELISFCKNKIENGETAGYLPNGIAHIKAVFFDMDATVIAEESLVEIAALAGKKEEIERITTEAMTGKMDFSESLRKRVGKLKGVSKSIIESLTPTYNLGIEELAKEFKVRGFKLFLVSGGFTELASRVSKHLGFDDFHANSFEWEKDKLTGGLVGSIVDAQGKVNAVENWCKKFNLKPENCMAVGDGANDLLMLNHVNIAVGFKPKKVLWPHLDICNNIGDHRLLLIK